MSHRFEQIGWSALGLVILAAWFALFNGWGPLLVLLGAAVVHELGHCAVLALFGAEVLRCRLSLFGAEICADSLKLSYGKELAAVLAGPAADLVCGAALSAGAAAGRLPYSTAGAFWVLGIFNLLPIRQLDGGRAVQLLFSWMLGPDAGEQIASALGAATALGLAAALLLTVRATGGNLWLMPAAMGAAAAGIREIRHQQRKHLKKRRFGCGSSA